MLADEINDRQYELDLKKYQIVIVIGVGGIGSWVALNLGLSGLVKKLIIIDPDTVEESNLNRTPFRLIDIDAFKADAICDLILERRFMDIISFKSYTSPELYDKIKNVIQEDKAIYTDVAVVDCRDNIYDDMYKLPAAIYYKVGYDGLDITIDGDPENTHVFSDGSTGYRVVPSFLCPTQLAANLVVSDLLVEHSELGKVPYYNTDPEGRLFQAVSFSSKNLLKLIAKASQ